MNFVNKSAGHERKLSFNAYRQKDVLAKNHIWDGIYGDVCSDQKLYEKAEIYSHLCPIKESL